MLKAQKIISMDSFLGKLLDNERKLLILPTKSITQKPKDPSCAADKLRELLADRRGEEGSPKQRI